jgi:23S rRNA-/tRNA-specific pseudouridylate synthase
MADLHLDGITIVHRSSTDVVLVKPAGVPAEMRADPGAVSILERVRRSGWPDARLPHRLDRVTSGLQVVVRDALAVAVHNDAILHGTWTKRYVVRIGAEVDADALLGEHRRNLRRRGRVAEVVRAGGKPSRLEVEAVAPDPERGDCQQVLVRLITGRYHQIRAMFADLDAPLVGDERYGGRPDPDGPWLEHAQLTLPLTDQREPVVLTVPESARRLTWAPDLAVRLAPPAAPAEPGR